jgi:hypothetical protein
MSLHKLLDVGTQWQLPVVAAAMLGLLCIAAYIKHERVFNNQINKHENHNSD